MGGMYMLHTEMIQLMKNVIYLYRIKSFKRNDINEII